MEEHTGFIGIVEPGSSEVIFKEFRYNDSEESINSAFIEIIKTVTGKEDGKISNAGFLPNPFTEFTMFMNHDQFDPDIKYNVGFFGTPIFGTMVFLQVLPDEDKTVRPISEDKKDILSRSIANLKKFEKESGIYDAMIKTDKNKFLEEFIKEQNTILEETTKDIEGKNNKELEKAKEELKATTGSDEVDKDI